MIFVGRTRVSGSNAFILPPSLPALLRFLYFFPGSEPASSFYSLDMDKLKLRPLLLLGDFFADVLSLLDDVTLSFLTFELAEDPL